MNVNVLMVENNLYKGLLFIVLFFFFMFIIRIKGYENCILCRRNLLLRFYLKVFIYLYFVLLLLFDCKVIVICMC